MKLRKQNGVRLFLLPCQRGKAVEKVLLRQLFLFFARNIEDDVPLVHHDQPVAVGNGVFHVVGDHERRQTVFLDDLVRQLQNLCCRRRVERCGVLVKQQQLRLLQRRHQKRQCLPLTAGQKPDLVGHALFQPQPQRVQPVIVILALLFRHAPFERALFAAPQRQRQIFLDLHVGRGAEHRVLEHATDKRRALVLRQRRHVHAVNEDVPLVDRPDARDGVQERRFARAVAADDSDEIAVVEAQAQILQRLLGVNRAGMERFRNRLP